MQEVVATIKFQTACLGGVRKEEVDEMFRDSDGKVLFLQTWWKALFSYAAKALNISPDKVSEIKLDPVVEGCTTLVKRYFGSEETAFKWHEAFDKDQQIELNAMLPDGLTAKQFEDLLRVGGKYVGISPYGHSKGYGRFTVVEVRPKN